MGPSGAGKSTLLDILAGRKASTTGNIAIDRDGGVKEIVRVSSYVEQDDALLGVLTVRETVRFSALLSLMESGASRAEIMRTADETIESLGLQGVADNRVGTPLQRGISGGQKRRLTVATSVVAHPRILFLDEPVSGLDSATAFEVMSAIQRVAKARNIAVVATIHSPTWETFALFDSVLLLAGGETMFRGRPDEVVQYFGELGHSCPSHTNPADHMMSLVNSDFTSKDQAPDGLVKGNSHAFAEAWRLHPWSKYASPEVQSKPPSSSRTRGNALSHFFKATLLLSQRNLLNYSRNLLAYGVRFAMYIGMGVLLATVWVNLPQLDSRINDRLSVHFFSVAFLGFMSVAGIPAFLEERSVFLRERKNNLYGPGPYTVAQTVCTLPFLFACVLIFAIISYWSIGLHSGANEFFRWMVFVYLGVLAAEMQSLLIAAIVPTFVASLALAAFLNGFWMAVQGYFMRNLPSFWYSWAHWIDYQTFAFQLLVKSDFTGLIFPCEGNIAASSCHCTFSSSLIAAGQCAVDGSDVIKSLGYEGASFVFYAFIIVIITVFYRLAFYSVLRLT
ncbi:P-loop containing nucleoside triphosphate hydrolase protein [Tilletiaria anomala UBC 951]|uniref:p-loop containing nucleoside triphosphate hydrolase protein n=1 Tax=Tilletiaria anomala (strain ATCC 24038 / CBS 436.72 / UBC 951) TaxID=1037660 RepID=A0A066V7I5_TILAU|nr:P-loop containing nucleoside triphosphate hydrolase protein [Tilletiaria anomala UBC 951]KDN36243.1 P-loop containing nucleoside triphosphate hydrolase protein [Tilletiaria anomala UBC 951]